MFLIEDLFNSVSVTPVKLSLTFMFVKKFVGHQSCDRWVIYSYGEVCTIKFIFREIIV